MKKIVLFAVVLLGAFAHWVPSKAIVNSSCLKINKVSCSNDAEAMLSLLHVSSLMKKMNKGCCSLDTVCSRIRNEEIGEIDQSNLRSMVAWLNAYLVDHRGDDKEEALLCDLILNFFSKCINLEKKRKMTEGIPHNCSFSKSVVDLLEECDLIDNVMYW